MGRMGLAFFLKTIFFFFLKVDTTTRAFFATRHAREYLDPEPSLVLRLSYLSLEAIKEAQSLLSAPMPLRQGERARKPPVSRSRRPGIAQIGNQEQERMEVHAIHLSMLTTPPFFE